MVDLDSQRYAEEVLKRDLVSIDKIAEEVNAGFLVKGPPTRSPKLLEFKDVGNNVLDNAVAELDVLRRAISSAMFPEAGLFSSNAASVKLLQSRGIDNASFGGIPEIVSLAAESAALSIALILQCPAKTTLVRKGLHRPRGNSSISVIKALVAQIEYQSLLIENGMLEYILTVDAQRQLRERGFDLGKTDTKPILGEVFGYQHAKYALFAKSMREELPTRAIFGNLMREIEFGKIAERDHERLEDARACREIDRNAPTWTIDNFYWKSSSGVIFPINKFGYKMGVKDHLSDSNFCWV